MEQTLAMFPNWSLRYVSHPSPIQEGAAICMQSTGSQRGIRDSGKSGVGVEAEVGERNRPMVSL